MEEIYCKLRIKWFAATIKGLDYKIEGYGHA